MSTPETTAPAASTAAPPAAVPDIDNVEEIALCDLVARAHASADAGMRFITATCLDSDQQFEIYYHFDDKSVMRSLHITVDKATDAVHVPTITSAYMCAFLIENELQNLFGIKVDGLAIDFGGKLLTADGPPPLLKCTKTAC